MSQKMTSSVASCLETQEFEFAALLPSFLAWLSDFASVESFVTNDELCVIVLEGVAVPHLGSKCIRIVSTALLSCSKFERKFVFIPYFKVRHGIGLMA